MQKAAVKLSDYIHITYLLSTSLTSCNLKNGFRRFFHTYVTITDSQPHKKRMLIVIHSFELIHLSLWQRAQPAAFDNEICGRPHAI